MAAMDTQRLIATLFAAAVVSGVAAGAASADSIAYIKGGNVWLTTGDASREFQVTSTGGYSAVSQATARCWPPPAATCAGSITWARCFRTSRRRSPMTPARGCRSSTARLTPTSRPTGRPRPTATTTPGGPPVRTATPTSSRTTGPASPVPRRSPDSPSRLQVFRGLGRQALRPWAAPQMYLNFSEDDDDPSTFWTPEDYERLRAVKASVDPDGLIRANHAIAAE